MQHTEILSIVAAALTMASAIPYVLDTCSRRTIPHRISWFAFTLLSATATIAQIRRGADAGAWLTAGSTVAFGIIFLASLRYGVGGVNRSSAFALIVLAVGIAAWLLTDSPIVAIVAAMVCDAAAISLTVTKAYQQPKSETRSTWLIDGSAGLIAVLATGEVTAVGALYPLYHVASNASVLVAMSLGGRWRIAHPLEALARDLTPTGW